MYLYSTLSVPLPCLSDDPLISNSTRCPRRSYYRRPRPNSTSQGIENMRKTLGMYAAKIKTMNQRGKNPRFSLS